MHKKSVNQLSEAQQSDTVTTNNDCEDEYVFSITPSDVKSDQASMPIFPITLGAG